MTLYYFLCILLIYNNSVKQFILFCSSSMNMKFVQTPKRDNILSEGNQTATYWLKSKNNSMIHFMIKWIYGKYNIENWKFANYCENWFSQFNFPNVCDNEWYKEWQRATSSGNECYKKWQWVITNDSEWHWTRTSNNGWQRMGHRVTASDNKWSSLS